MPTELMLDFQMMQAPYSYVGSRGSQNNVQNNMEQQNPWIAHVSGQLRIVYLLSWLLKRQLLLTPPSLLRLSVEDTIATNQEVLLCTLNNEKETSVHMWNMQCVRYIKGKTWKARRLKISYTCSNFYCSSCVCSNFFALIIQSNLSKNFSHNLN